LSTGKILMYGSGKGELLYQRSEVYMVLNRTKKSDPHEPAMYRLNDDHIAFVFCEYSFVVLMAGKLHYSTSFVYHKPTRRVIAEAHRWMFDFIFSRDFSYVERGTYHSLTSREAHIFGTASGQLLFQRMDGKLRGAIILLLNGCLFQNFTSHYTTDESEKNDALEHY